MFYFDNYVSNTVAGSGNQSFFEISDKEAKVCRIFYKILKSGRYNYSLLFSNTIDSTYADGSHSYKNLVMDTWKIINMRACITSSCSPDVNDNSFTQILFGGIEEKTVEKGELFSTDPIELSASDGDYICVEIAFTGKMIPHHPESIIPSFVKENDAWVSSTLHPYPSMIGVNRKVTKRIGFFGDSITQGCGTEVNGYAHWNAVLAKFLGDKYAYWNLGLGYGRADDAASKGIWYQKAKNNDTVFVCFGVNDIIQGFSAQQIKSNLQSIVDGLISENIQVILQTVPPFDYNEYHRVIWDEVNTFIKSELSKKCFVFDCVEILRLSDEEPYMSKFNGHPNETGCALWANALFGAVKDLLSE